MEKLILKLTSASTEVGVEAKAELGNITLLQINALATIIVKLVA